MTLSKNYTFALISLLIFSSTVISGGNTPPTADAGFDNTYDTLEFIILDGSNSNANDVGQTLTYQWEQVSGEPVSLSDITIPNPVFEAPKLSPDQVAIELVFSLVVNDGVEDSQADTVTITVQPNPLPKPVFNTVIVNHFVDPTNSRTILGDLLFTPDGMQARMIVGSENENSVVMIADVARDANMNVTGFSNWTEEFAIEYLDTGLEYAPDSDSLFYFVSDVGIGQRTSLGAEEMTAVQNYDSGYGGMAVIPNQYSNGGDILKAEYDAGRLFLHPVADDGDDTFTISPATLVSQLPYDATGDIHYITSGLLANHIAVASYDYDDSTIYLIPVDPVTGLPGPQPQYTVLVNQSDNAWGITIDPVTGHLWLVEFGTMTLTQYMLDELIYQSGFE